MFRPNGNLKRSTYISIIQIDPTEFHAKLEQRLPQYKGRWKKSMADQMQDLPDFETVLRKVMRHLREIG